MPPRERRKPSPLLAWRKPICNTRTSEILFSRPIYHFGQREDAPGLSAFWANRQYFPSSCMTNCQAGKKQLVVRLLFPCPAVLCRASMVTLLTGPLVVVTTDRQLLHQDTPKLPPDENCPLEARGNWISYQPLHSLFLLLLPSEHSPVILCRQQAPEVSSLFSYWSFSCSPVHRSTCEPDLCYIPWMKNVIQPFGISEGPWDVLPTAHHK